MASRPTPSYMRASTDQFDVMISGGHRDKLLRRFGGVPLVAAAEGEERKLLAVREILRSCMRGGAARSVTFAFELHRVFEDFLEVGLRTALRRRGAQLLRQPKGRSLDSKGTLGLEPDFVAVRDGRPISVLDAKFKRLEQDLGGDAYQLLAYLLELGPRAGFLVSASGARSDRRVRAVDKILGVRPLGLDQPPERVLTQIDELAEEATEGYGGVERDVILAYATA